MSGFPRAYTLEEIDAMREDIWQSFPSGVSYNQAQRAGEVEQMLRTYMMAGVGPTETAEKRKRREAANRELAREIAQVLEKEVHPDIPTSSRPWMA